MLLLTAENVDVSEPGSPGVPGFTIFLFGVALAGGVSGGSAGSDSVLVWPGSETSTVWAHAGPQYQQESRSPRRRSQGVFILFVVVVGCRLIVVLLNVILLNIVLLRVDLRNIVLRNPVLRWRRKHPSPANVLRLGSIRRVPLDRRLVYSVGHLRNSSTERPYLLTIWSELGLTRDRSLHPDVRTYGLVVLRLVKLEFDDPFFFPIRQLSENQAWILVGYNLDQP
jgi:hypothetical protein